MAGEEPPKLPLNVELSAKAELKAEIPPATMGRLVDALTDAIRPFTERRGLKADVIRLQREEIAISIAQMATRRAAIERLELHPVPTKFLVSFLERASLETNDTALHERWAALLLSAATSYEASHLTFIDIMSRLSAAELSLVEGVCLADSGFPSRGTRTFVQYANNENDVRRNGRSLDTRYKKGDPLISKVFRKFLDETPLTFGQITDATVFFEEEAFFEETTYSNESARSSLQLLERERLVNIRNVSIIRKTGVPPNIEIGYFEITPLGLKFVEDCSPSAASRTKVS